MNKKIRIAAASSVAMLIVLILLSGTIYNFNRPSVTAAMPVVGHLNHVEITSGVVRHGLVTEVYAEILGWASTVLVTEGEFVTAGQVLIEMDFRSAIPDTQASILNAKAVFDESMESLAIDRANNRIELERINADIQNIQQQMANLRSGSFNRDSSSYFELQQNQIAIDQAEESLSQIRILFNAGVATGLELADAEKSLNELINRREHLQQQHYEAKNDWEQERENNLHTLEQQLETRNRDRQSRNLNTDSYALREEILRRELNNSIEEYEHMLSLYYEFATITSPVDGVIIYLPVNSGQHVNTNQLIASIGVANSLVVECEIPINNSFVNVGSLALLRNSSHVIEGIVTQVTPAEDVKRVIISIEYDNITAGESFTVQFEEQSSVNFTLVPNGAIGRDSEGYFIRPIRRRRGVLGDEFYTQRLRVMLGDSDSQFTAVIHGITFFEPIVVLSDRTIAEGQSINLRNESDFFEN